ncbi:MAG: hypothetical protein R3233_07405, partial [Xanthomonadales bacterium]|nr:hypothetical protein [Xanthomonadales bacterium]
VYAATAADVAAAWAELAAATGARLQCCSAAVERRLAGPPGAPFEVAGLVAWCETLPGADRLVSF